MRLIMNQQYTRILNLSQEFFILSCLFLKLNENTQWNDFQRCVASHFHYESLNLRQESYFIMLVSDAK